MKTVYKIKVEQTFIPYKVTFFRKKIKELERSSSGHEYYYVVASSDQEAIDKVELLSFYYSYNLFPYGNFEECCGGYGEVKDIQLDFFIVSRHAQDLVSIDMLKKELIASDFVDFFGIICDNKNKENSVND